MPSEPWGRRPLFWRVGSRAGGAVRACIGGHEEREEVQVVGVLVVVRKEIATIATALWLVAY